MYEIELFSDYSEWGRYNLFLSLAGYDASGKRILFESLTDRVRNIMDEKQSDLNPGRRPGTKSVLSIGKCAWAEAYINIVTNTLPQTHAVDVNPFFEAELIAKADGRELFRMTLQVSLWGGLSLAGLLLESPKE